MTFLTELPDAYYANLLGVPVAAIQCWYADEEGLHTRTRTGVPHTNHLVSAAALAEIHPALLTALRAMSATEEREATCLFVQMQHLLAPLQLTDVTGTTYWLDSIYRLTWGTGNPVVHVHAWICSLDATQTRVVNVNSDRLAIPVGVFDAHAPGWRDRYLVADALGLTGVALVQYVCTVPPELAPVATDLSAITLD